MRSGRLLAVGQGGWKCSCRNHATLGEAWRHVDRVDAHRFRLGLWANGRGMRDLADTLSRRVVLDDCRFRLDGARQRPTRVVRHDHLSGGRLKADDQVNLLLGAADLVPGQKKAVGVTQVRFTVVQRQLFGGKDVFSFRHAMGRIASIVLESVDGHRAVNFDRVLVLFRVEHDATAETALAGLSDLMAHRVGPHANHAAGNSGLLLDTQPRGTSVPIGGGTAGCGGQTRQRDESNRRNPALLVRHPVHNFASLRRADVRRQAGRNRLSLIDRRPRRVRLVLCVAGCA